VPSNKPTEQYTIRRQVFKFFGAGFHIYNPEGTVVGYCKQKAFKLREDLRIYTDDSKSTELLHIATKSIIDFGAAYEVALPTGESLGTVRRKGMKSLIRDSWLIYNAEGAEIAKIEEDSQTKAIFRRLLGDYASLLPQSFTLTAQDNAVLATYRTHFNLFIYRLSISITENNDDDIDDLMLLAIGVLLGAIEGRQN
jgi:uncharacterized protein YxjI